MSFTSETDNTAERLLVAFICSKGVEGREDQAICFRTITLAKKRKNPKSGYWANSFWALHKFIE
jgi:hypothetical protein